MFVVAALIQRSRAAEAARTTAAGEYRKRVTEAQLYSAADTVRWAADGDRARLDAATSFSASVQLGSTSDLYCISAAHPGTYKPPAEAEAQA